MFRQPNLINHSYPDCSHSSHSSHSSAVVFKHKFSFPMKLTRKHLLTYSRGKNRQEARVNMRI
jgi:hypothetical protein